MKRESIKHLCITAFLTALVCILTMVIQIPVPATSGYIHLGDSMILIAAILFGWKYGTIAGGVGSMLADILSGYAYWAPFTLVIKALMGFAAGKIASKDEKVFSLRNILAAFVAIIIMIVGYLIGGAMLKGGILVSLVSMPANMIQGFAGLVIYLVLGKIMEKSNITLHITNR